MMKRKYSKTTDILMKDSTVLAVILFGSRARGDERGDSDCDLCVVLNRKQYTAKELSKLKLRCHTLVDADIQIFQQLPIYIQQRVIKEGKVLACRNEQELYEVAFQMIREFGDFEHIYREYLEEVARG